MLQRRIDFLGNVFYNIREEKKNTLHIYARLHVLRDHNNKCNPNLRANESRDEVLEFANRHMVHI